MSQGKSQALPSCRSERARARSNSHSHFTWSVTARAGRCARVVASAINSSSVVTRAAWCEASQVRSNPAAGLKPIQYDSFNGAFPEPKINPAAGDVLVPLCPIGVCMLFMCPFVLQLLVG